MHSRLASVIGSFVSPLPNDQPIQTQKSPEEIEQTFDRCMLFSANVAIETTTETQQLKQYQDWLWSFEDAMPVTATPDELLELLTTAPTPYAKGLIAGICAARIEMAAISGRL